MLTIYVINKEVTHELCTHLNYFYIAIQPLLTTYSSINVIYT